MERYPFSYAICGITFFSLSLLLKADLIFPDFSTTEGLTLLGNATQEGNVLRVTPASKFNVGAAWSTTKQEIGKGFLTTFDFNIATPGGEGGADGFAFVIQNVSDGVIASTGGNMGYGGNIGIPGSLAIEFDTFSNSANEEPLTDHISVQTNGTLRNSPEHQFSLGSITLAEGDLFGTHQVTIEYHPGILDVFFDNSAVLSVNIDIRATLGLNDDFSFVGFTAATGGGIESHDITSFRFTSVPEPSSIYLLAITIISILAYLSFEKVCKKLTNTSEVNSC